MTVQNPAQNPAKTPRRTLRKVLLATAGATCAIALLPLALPAEAHVERTTVIDAEASELYALVASNEGYQRFNPYKDADPQLQIDLFGPSSGVGSGFHFDGADGTGTQTVAAVEPGRSVLMDIDLGAMGRPQQRFVFEPAPGGTRVTWQLDADLGYNPLARVAGLFMDDMMGSTFERGLANLGNAAT